MIPKSYFDFYNKAFQLRKAGVDLRFIAGNHDYWVLDFMKEKLMNHTYFDDTTFSIRGKNFYITHGDGLLSWDYGYRILKKIIRSPFFIWCFRSLHPTTAYKIARKVSRTENHPELPTEIKNKVRTELKKQASSHFEKGFDYMVCGHYHLNELIDAGKGKLAVLGDWQDQPSYAVFDGKELTLHQWENDD
jgi:UDP-2,3-diacylglucosamine hydrolase